MRAILSSLLCLFALACAGPSAVRGPGYASEFQSAVGLGADSRPGDRFEGRLRDPLLDGGGRELIPAGTHVTGTIEDVTERVHPDLPAVLVLRIEHPVATTMVIERPSRVAAWSEDGMQGGVY